MPPGAGRRSWDSGGTENLNRMYFWQVLYEIFRSPHEIAPDGTTGRRLSEFSGSMAMRRSHLSPACDEPVQSDVRLVEC